MRTPSILIYNLLIKKAKTKNGLNVELRPCRSGWDLTATSWQMQSVPHIHNPLLIIHIEFQFTIHSEVLYQITKTAKTVAEYQLDVLSGNTLTLHHIHAVPIANYEHQENNFGKGATVVLI